MQHVFEISITIVALAGAWFLIRGSLKDAKKNIEVINESVTRHTERREAKPEVKRNKRHLNSLHAHQSHL